MSHDAAPWRTGRRLMHAALRNALKSAYAAVPFKRQLFGAMRWMHPAPNLYQHLHFTGPFTVEVAPDARFRLISYGDVMENELFWSGYGRAGEAMSLRLWERLARHADGTIFDIGANTGVFALAARSVNPTSRIVAFEPLKRILSRLEANVSLNGFDIEIVGKAVSDHSGAGAIHDSADPNSDINNYSASLEAGFEINDRCYEVATVALDDWLAEESGKVSLIKLDVELHEPAAIRGMAGLLRRDRPAMVVEVLTGDIAREIDSQLSGLGYRYYRIDEALGLIPAATPQPMQGNNRNNLLCQDEYFDRSGLRDFLAKANAAMIQ